MSGNVGAFICSVRFSIVCALGTVCGDWVWSTRAEHFLLATFWEQNMTCCCIRSASASLRSRARSASERSTLSRQVVLGLPRSGVRSGSSPPSLSRQVGLGPPSLALLASQVGFGPLTLALASGRPLPPPSLLCQVCVWHPSLSCQVGLSLSFALSPGLPRTVFLDFASGRLRTSRGGAPPPLPPSHDTTLFFNRVLRVCSKPLGSMKRSTQNEWVWRPPAPELGNQLSVPYAGYTLYRPRLDIPDPPAKIEDKSPLPRGRQGYRSYDQRQGYGGVPALDVPCLRVCEHWCPNLQYRNEPRGEWIRVWGQYQWVPRWWW